MYINEIFKESSKPEIYTPGSHVMWTDEHISNQLLQVHLNKDVDLASRKESAINKTTDWILSRFTENEKTKLDILDLGCGPGLYTERFAELGHNVTGIDYSENSIGWAKSVSEKNSSSVDYRCGNYLELDFPDSSFDLIIMIFTDFGVLIPAERLKLLNKITRSLKPGGLFIFDVLCDKNWNQKAAPSSWDCCQGGFWSSDDYLALSESYIYDEEKVILNKHIIAEDNEIKSYHFWIHFFSHQDITTILSERGFRILSFNEDVLPEGGEWSGDNVTFTVAELI